MRQFETTPARPIDFRLLAERFKQVSEIARLRVLLSLGEDDRSVGELAATVGLRMSALSRHLSRLRLAGLVESARDGQRNVYALTAEGRNLRRNVMQLFD